MDAVGFIVTDPHLASWCESMAGKRGIEGKVIVSLPEASVKAVRDLESQGVWAIVAPLHLAHQLQGHSSVPIVSATPGPFDLLAALDEAKSVGSVVALLHFSSSCLPIPFMEKLLDLELREVIPGRSKRETREALERATASGVQVVVTGGPAAEVAKEMGLFTVEVTLGQEALEEALNRALEIGNVTQRLSGRLRRFAEIYQKDQDYLGIRVPLKNLVAESPVMKRLKAYLEGVCQEARAILIMGEPGAGRHFLARQLHEAGPRGEGPFIHLPCHDYAQGDLEETLRAAKGGTLFLEDIESLPSSIYNRVRTLLETVKGPGGPESTPVLYASATPNPSHSLKSTLFDGFPVSVRVPPLRERREDIAPLFKSLIMEARSPILSKILDEGLLSDEGWKRLQRYPWPGNVGELKSLALRYVTAVSSLPLESLSLIEMEILEELEGGPKVFKGDQIMIKMATLEEMIDEILEQVMSCAEGNRSEVARRLGISRTTLWKRLKKKGECS